MAVFLVLLALGASGFLGGFNSSRAETKGILGGPVARYSNDEYTAKFAALIAAPRGAILVPADQGPAMISAAVALNANIKDEGQPIGPAYSRSNILIYKVRRGDNLSRIAASFGISMQTITSANPKVRASSLRIGDELKILPTSGAIYAVKPGDTLESIATYYNVPEAKIKQLNKSVNLASLGVGVLLVVPGVQAFKPSAAELASAIDAPRYFIMPTTGYNWGKLHHYNAVDIANTCGTPVVAAAEGLVVPDENFGDGHDGWNGGYGSFVLLEHPGGNGLRTRYAHLSKIFVEIGDYVKQGQKIGLMGDTGDATGCHLHFEIYGAENPFAKY